LKPSKLGTPERDLGWAEIRPLAENLIGELERQAKKIQELERGRQPAAPPLSPGLAEARRLLANLAMRTGDAVTLERQRVLHRALDEEYFRRELVATKVNYENGAADAKNGGAFVMRMPATAGTNPMLHDTVLERDLWPRTRPRLTIWYTSPVGSTNAFNLRFQLVHFPAGLTTAVAAVFSTVFQPAGPAVANTILSASVVGGAVVPSIASPIRLSIVRIGGDANANSLDILTALVTFEEIA
jgi:hypothetical protein